METCRVCNPDLKDADSRKRNRKSKGEVTLDLYVRRQVSQELGEDEPTKDQRFVLLQKYGVTAPRIDRQITKPSWMGVSEWKRKMNEWYKATKGLVAQTPPANTHMKRRGPYPTNNPNRPWVKANRPQGMKIRRGSCGPTRTETRQQ
jgi:hypothetical protein